MSGAPRAGALAGPLLLGAGVGSLVAGRFETALACLAVSAVASRIAGAPWPPPAFFRGLALGSVVALVLNALLVRGTPLPVPLPGRLVASVEGLRLGALLALRLVGAATALHGLRSAWPGERAADELADRLRALEVLRVPVRAARVVVGMAVRFAPLVAAEAGRIVRLQDLRAGGPPRSTGQWVERRRAALVPLVVCTLERAERVALAMEARHYRVRPVPRLERRGGAELLGLALAAVALVWRA